ncbi:efflux transporter outer membrane subunit [Nitrosovibrio tenuis]|uniref:Efflux transporter, outer membrane factor (OMF) lipoprotein, NodT family n=1 Tax=Nitrosovibrio tenuis TaxID=1233 RepID=A0A1H7G5Q7_9PROT|nr:efflux transporter outer membrane subunit [Nitrosovibrio tenuis]SEK32787.1 efflux transporter, outer membrane factor (OMF) lipoprotein, NodT family [Nitrosovibrio tenuis]
MHPNTHLTMIDLRCKKGIDISNLCRLGARFGSFLFVAASLTACANLPFPAFNLSPTYQKPQFVVPDSWEGSGPFVKANPSDDALRPDWWTLYNDPILTGLVEQGMAANPDLHAAAERFVQARNSMMKARSRYFPQLGFDFGASNNRQSDHSLFRGLGEPNTDVQVAGQGIASWEPDFWSKYRNAAQAAIYRAEERAADYGLARLILQAEIASNYFMLRGLDAQIAIYTQSIDLYKYSLEVVVTQFEGKIASNLDVARAKSLLFTTESTLALMRGDRKVAEQAIAILLNLAPASFKLDPIDNLLTVNFSLPKTIPSTLLERRPDIAGMERRMAQANREIGIARAAFFPDIAFRVGGGMEDSGLNLLSLANSFWAYGSSFSIPLFQGGYRRAQLQQSWSVYRETENLYRSTVLKAFREVENNLTQTYWMTVAAERQDAAVEAARTTQNLTMDLYKGGLASSLELIYSQIGTLTTSINSVQIKTNRLISSVGLIRALGGGWDRGQLPADDQIQPFGTLQYTDLDKPPPAGGIDVNADPIDRNDKNNNLTKPLVPIDANVDQSDRNNKNSNLTKPLVPYGGS